MVGWGGGKPGAVREVASGVLTRVVRGMGRCAGARTLTNPGSPRCNTSLHRSHHTAGCAHGGDVVGDECELAGQDTAGDGGLREDEGFGCGEGEGTTSE